MSLSSTHAFGPRYSAQASPVYRALWQGSIASAEFAVVPLPSSSDKDLAQDLQQLVSAATAANTLLNGQGKYSEAFLHSLGAIGFWGLLAPQDCGGSELPFATYLRKMSQVATQHSSLAGLASVHNAIGAAPLLARFGSDEQKKRLLPALVTGEKLSAFAMTEPGAGSDLTALACTAIREGDHYTITGEKVFITNANYNRRIALVAMCEGEPAMFVVDLPMADTSTFQLVSYGLHPLKRSHNHGLRLDRFDVPLQNRIVVPGGNGLTAAYFGLNQGRAAIAAIASGSLRKMLADLLPWVKRRISYGKPLADYELVMGRIARLASLIVGCDLLARWCGGLLDAGYRGELEGIIAKVFASAALEEGAISLSLKTHGGRALLQGHPIGDGLMDYLAPSIYEGENQLLGLGLMKTLLRIPSENVAGANSGAFESAYCRLATEVLAKVREAILQKPSPRQLQVAQWSQRIQQAIVLFLVAHHQAAFACKGEQLAADLLCQQLSRGLTGKLAADHEHDQAVHLAKLILSGDFAPLYGLEGTAPLLEY